MDYVCEKCSRQYAHEKTLIRHLKSCSGNGSESETKQIRCPECKTPFMAMEALKKHVESDHNVKLEDKKYFFKTINDFLDWKLNMEKETGCYYFQKSPGLFSGVKRTYYFCHRSGYTNNRPGKIRRTRSIKIDATCTSTLIVIQGECGVDVIFCKTHFGHGSSSERCLTENEREIVAEKIADRVPMKEILDQVNDRSFSNGDVKIVTTIHDLLNIQKDYNDRITKNHYKSQLIKDQKVLQISDSMWIVESNSGIRQVTRIRASCDKKSCILRCHFCNICTHLYACDCLEHTSRPSIYICTHIHTCLLKKGVFDNHNLNSNIGASSSSGVENTENEILTGGKQEKVLIFYSTEAGCSKINVSE